MDSDLGREKSSAAAIAGTGKALCLLPGKKKPAETEAGGDSIFAGHFEPGGYFKLGGSVVCRCPQVSRGGVARGDVKRDIPIPAISKARDRVSRLFGGFFAEAIGRVVVHHAHRLHEGIHRGGADEIEARFFQGLGERIGFRRAGDEIIE